MLWMLRRARVTKKDWNLNDSQRRFYDPPLYSLDPAPDGESETRRLEISFQLFQ